MEGDGCTAPPIANDPWAQVVRITFLANRFPPQQTSQAHAHRLTAILVTDFHRNKLRRLRTISQIPSSLDSRLRSIKLGTTLLSLLIFSAAGCAGTEQQLGTNRQHGDQRRRRRRPSSTLSFFSDARLYLFLEDSCGINLRRAALGRRADAPPSLKCAEEEGARCGDRQQR